MVEFLITLIYFSDCFTELTMEHLNKPIAVNPESIFPGKACLIRVPTKVDVIFSLISLYRRVSIFTWITSNLTSNFRVLSTLSSETLHQPMAHKAKTWITVDCMVTASQSPLMSDATMEQLCSTPEIITTSFSSWSSMRVQKLLKTRTSKNAIQELMRKQLFRHSINQIY